MHTRTLLPALLSAGASSLLLVSAAAADTIYLTDGTTIADVSVQTERLDNVSYKDDKRKDGSVPSDKVLFIEFSTKPQLVDRADTAIDEENLLDAEADLENFLQGLEKSPRKWPWSRAYALFRLIEVYEIMGQLPQVAATADRLTELEPDSRYLPFAQMKKAQALFDAEKGADALSAMSEFNGMIQSRGLGERWKLESELGEILFDGSIKGKKRHDKLAGISERAGSGFPIVRNRAEVAIAEGLLLAGDHAEAEKIFRAVTDDPKADSRTLAAAFTGLGDCLWGRGEPLASEDSGKKILEEALLAYMRVVVVYKNELNYVPKAMFQAGRCFQLIGGDNAEASATQLYNKVIRTYRDSRWAQEARGFRKKK